MKRCFKCGREKPLSEFYPHPRMADGRLNKCKACTKADVGAHRQRNLERIRDYDRQRGYRPSKRAKTEKRQKADRESSRRYRQRNRAKKAAHSLVAYALLTGTLKKQPCAYCGAKKVEAHHEDYLKPLEVTWLCRKHHGQRHREINEEQRNGAPI